MQPVKSQEQTAKAAAAAIKKYYEAKYNTVMPPASEESTISLVRDLFTGHGEDGFYEFKSFSQQLMIFFAQKDNMDKFKESFKSVTSVDVFKIIERIHWFFEDLHDHDWHREEWLYYELNCYYSYHDAEWYEQLREEYEIKFQVWEFEQKLKLEKKQQRNAA